MYIAQQPAAAGRLVEILSMLAEGSNRRGKLAGIKTMPTGELEAETGRTRPRARGLRRGRDGDVDDHSAQLVGTISSLGCIDYRHDEWGGRCGGRRIASMASAWLEVPSLPLRRLREQHRRR